MDPASLSNANALLRAQGLRPRKRWGQNFLCDRNVLERIARAAALDPGDHTLEIGAGLGALTRFLADFSLSVTAIEIDTLLEPILRETLDDKPNVRVIYEDFLKLDISKLLDEAFGCLQRLNPALSRDDIKASKVARLRFAQPVCEPGFAAKIPPVQTPIEGLQIADTCYYYPEDRGISESVHLGKEMAACLKPA